MRCIPVGADALLVEVSDVREATALYAEARRREVRARDIVPAARTVLFDGVDDVDTLLQELRRWSVASSGAVPGEVVEVPTTYDGPDLEDVAAHWELSPEEVVGLHTGTEFLVAFCGFAPGFAYCTGLPAGLTVPRRPEPRSRVPAGSVGLAGEFTGVYPTSSPGGWQLIGRTDLRLWDESADPPATLPPGTRVRFRRS